MRRTTVFVGGLVWVLVVAGASLVTWRVIDAAGRDVLSEQTQAGGSGTTGNQPDPGSTRVARPSEQTSETPSGKPSPGGSASFGAPAVEVRSWQGVAGTVVVQCLGGRASLRSTYPDVGWAYEVKRTGPVQVLVEFERDSSDGQARVRAGCVGGVPQFSLDDVEGGDGNGVGGNGGGNDGGDGGGDG